MTEAHCTKCFLAHEPNNMRCRNCSTNFVCRSQVISYETVGGKRGIVHKRFDSQMFGGVGEDVICGPVVEYAA